MNSQVKMKLFYSDASPFARKCRIVLRLKALLKHCDEIEATPLQNPPELLLANPIAQVPALILDDGKGVFNSPLICAYLDKIPDAPSIYGDDELEERRLETIGDAICEMAVKIRLEQLRPQNEQSPNWIARWNDNLNRILKFTDDEIGKANDKIHIGKISIGIALEYLSFRFEHIVWQDYENLSSLVKSLNTLTEFVETRPK